MHHIAHLLIGVGGTTFMPDFSINFCQYEKTMTLLEKIRNILKLSLLLLTFCYTSSLHAHKTIGITQIVDHPSLNAIRNGIVEELARNGYQEGNNLIIIYENAQGNPATAAQIARKFASLSLDVVVPISTPSAQAVVQQIKDSPIIFAAISDPLGAKIVPSLNASGGNVTGVADIPPVEKQLDFITQCLPQLKTLGVIYNPGEVNNVSLLERLEKAANEKNIQIKTASASKTTEINSAVNGLIDEVDALFIGNDNTIVSGLESIIKVALKTKKPFFVSDPDSVQRGALAAYAYDQHKIGEQVGRMILKVFKGKSPGKINVETPEDLQTYFNPRIAKILQVNCSTATSKKETP